MAMFFGGILVQVVRFLVITTTKDLPNSPMRKIKIILIVIIVIMMQATSRVSEKNVAIIISELTRNCLKITAYTFVFGLLALRLCLCHA